mmetsp:Transcript_93492/g.204711  ORF Transcript_93492/g.204711 Transcript_93492/m.204711 type:complete len:207 (+) Transcript_93492:482-1102(+)
MPAARDPVPFGVQVVGTSLSGHFMGDIDLTGWLVCSTKAILSVDCVKPIWPVAILLFRIVGPKVASLCEGLDFLERQIYRSTALWPLALKRPRLREASDRGAPSGDLAEFSVRHGPLSLARLEPGGVREVPFEALQCEANCGDVLRWGHMPFEVWVAMDLVCELAAHSPRPLGAPAPESLKHVCVCSCLEDADLAIRISTQNNELE